MLIHVCDCHDDELRPANPKSFTLDGKSVELDLCSSCETRLMEVLAPFIRAARRSPSEPSTSTTRAAKTPGALTQAVKNGHKPPPAVAPEGSAPASSDLTKEERDTVRKWAEGQGIYVYARGRVAQDIVNRYYNQVLA